MQKFKNAFTMIELIFVIVILGILAAVAIPKLSATRDDAKVAAEVSSVAQAIQNLGAEFTANGAFNNYTVADANNEVGCFVFTLNNAADGNISLAVINPASSTCPTVVLNAVAGMAARNGLTDTAGAIKTYVFGGAGIAE